MHTFVHVEIPTTDLKKAMSFYGPLFNWRFEQFYGDDYMMIFTGDGVQVGGLTKIKEVPLLEHHYSYVEVPDVAATMARAESLGGTVIRPLTELPGGLGAYSVIQCPDGHRIGVWSKR